MEGNPAIKNSRFKSGKADKKVWKELKTESDRMA